MIIHQFKIQIILGYCLFVGRKCDILKGRDPRFVTVCDRGGIKFVKSIVYIRYGQRLQLHKYNILMFNKF